MQSIHCRSVHHKIIFGWLGNRLVRWCWRVLQGDILVPLRIQCAPSTADRATCVSSALFPVGLSRRCSRIDLYTHGAQALVAGLSPSLSHSLTLSVVGYISSVLAQRSLSLSPVHTHTHTHTHREDTHTHTHTHTLERALWFSLNKDLIHGFLFLCT
jgi:hypothetical protein